MTYFDPLEPRRLFAATLTAEPAVDLAPQNGNQVEGAIAANPLDSDQLFAFSNTTAQGMTASTSDDGGRTWHPTTIATGLDGLESACCDPSCSFDSFGNLFIAYVNAKTNAVIIGLSTDGGHVFRQVTRFKGDIDQPTITAGPGGARAGGAVWVTFAGEGGITVASAAVNGLGNVGKFSARTKVPNSSDGNFGDIAIGPGGQVLVGYQSNSADDDPTSDLFVSLDPDGLGPLPFLPAVKIGTANVGPFLRIPPQDSRAIDAELALAFDNSDGPYRGRAYATYTDRADVHTDDTNVVVRHSDTLGSTWSAAQQVNDDATANSQFFPRAAVDPTTGLVGFSFYDARSDHGIPGQDSTDAVPNDDVDVYAAVGTPTPAGLAISPNVRVTQAVSDAAISQSDIDFGDYTGLAYRDGVLHPMWADNSNSAGDNPDGTLAALDMYTARATVTAADAPTGAPSSLLADDFAATVPHKTVKSGGSYSFTITYADKAILGAGSFSNANLQITSPTGTSFPARLGKVKFSKTRATVTAAYQFKDPTGKFTAADNGTWTVTVLPATLTDLLNHPNPTVDAGTFTVAVKSKAKHAAPPKFAPPAVFSALPVGGNPGDDPLA